MYTEIERTIFHIHLEQPRYLRTLTRPGSTADDDDTFPAPFVVFARCRTVAVVPRFELLAIHQLAPGIVRLFHQAPVAGTVLKLLTAPGMLAARQTLRPVLGIEPGLLVAAHHIDQRTAVVLGIVVRIGTGRIRAGRTVLGVAFVLHAAHIRQPQGRAAVQVRVLERFDVLAQRGRIGVAFVAARHLAHVRFVVRVRSGVLEPIGRVRVRFVASLQLAEQKQRLVYTAHPRSKIQAAGATYLHRADVRLFARV